MPEINVSRGLFYFPSSRAGEISVDWISVARLGAELRVARTKAVAFVISSDGMILPDRYHFFHRAASRVHEREREGLKSEARYHDDDATITECFYGSTVAVLLYPESEVSTVNGAKWVIRVQSISIVERYLLQK